MLKQGVCGSGPRVDVLVRAEHFLEEWKSDVTWKSRSDFHVFAAKSREARSTPARPDRVERCFGVLRDEKASSASAALSPRRTLFDQDLFFPFALHFGPPRLSLVPRTFANRCAGLG